MVPKRVLFAAAGALALGLGACDSDMWDILVHGPRGGEEEGTGWVWTDENGHTGYIGHDEAHVFAGRDDAEAVCWISWPGSDYSLIDDTDRWYHACTVATPEQSPNVEPAARAIIEEYGGDWIAFDVNWYWKVFKCFHTKGTASSVHR
ncbi:MAG: hypothetical protein MdMp014T_1209 [Treponematales bacterium]